MFYLIKLCSCSSLRISAWSIYYFFLCLTFFVVVTQFNFHQGKKIVSSLPSEINKIKPQEIDTIKAKIHVSSSNRW